MVEDAKKEARDDVRNESVLTDPLMERFERLIAQGEQPHTQPHGSSYGAWGQFFAVLGVVALAAAGVFAGLAWGAYGEVAGETASLFEGPFRFVIAAGGMAAVFALSRFYRFALNEAEADVREAQAHSADFMQDLMKIKNLVESGRDVTSVTPDITEPRAAG